MADMTQEEIEAARNEAYEERAAIIEYEAGLPRDMAESLALAAVAAMDDVDFMMGADEQTR